ncbi:MAG: SDR family NAD(P)-dependent oxidoreductase [Candidatus Limnocylindrales bacterium]
MTQRRVLVTGGGSGIGAAVGAVLAEEGWRVHLADIKPPADGHLLDVTDEHAWQRLFEEIGDIDALVNCAGVRTRFMIVDMEVGEFERVIGINLTGTFLGVRQAFRQWLRAERAGVIVNISSVNAFQAVPGQVHYVASKAAVAMLTKAAALEGAKAGIRVNAIAPGPVHTPMMEERLREPGQEEWLNSQVPLGRVAQPREIADAVSYLLSDRASYVTGSVLTVDGGWTAE